MQQTFLDLSKQYNLIFGSSIHQLYYFFSPGRVNLIGEHTDYNGGYVFPCTLSFGTFAIVSKRSDNNFKVHSLNYSDQGSILFANANLVLDKNHGWANYIKGVIKTITGRGYTIPHGLNILIFGNIPINSGLSSSASIEILIATILNNLFDLNIPVIELIKIAKDAENNFIQVNCGIMDQFIIGLGKKDHAVLLNCSSLDYDYFPIQLDQYKIVIANTNVPRTLASSKYNERRFECESALSELKSATSINSLCELTPENLNELKHLITNEIWYKRAYHAIHENYRALTGASILKNQDIETFGNLMNQSHISLRDNYDVTGIYLDTLVEAAWDNPSCIGARMTGAGFGGCTVNLVQNEGITEFIQTVGHNYQKKTSIQASFYIAETGFNAHEVILETIDAN